MASQKVKKVLLVLLHLVAQCVFSKINLLGNINFVGLPFAFVKLYFGSNIFSVTGFYTLSRLFLFKDMNWMLITAYEVVFLALYYFVNELLKSEKKYLVLNLFLSLSNVLLLYFSFDSTYKISLFVIGFVAEILVLLYFYKFNLVYKNKLVFIKLSKSDYFMFSVMVLFVSMGLFSYEFVYTKLSLLVIILFVIVLAKLLAIDKFFVSIIVFLIGMTLSTKSFQYFEMAIIFACVVSFFKDFNKYFYALILALILAILSIIFKFYDIFSVFLLIFAVFIYIIIPNKFIVAISSVIEADAMGVIFKISQDQKVNELRSRLMLMSSTLENMQKNFKFLLVGKIDREKACSELAGDIINKCCSECENFRFCFMENISKRAMFESMLLKAVENRQISNADLINGIQAYCHKSGIVASEINQMAKIYLSYESAMKTEDASKLLISSEIGNFAGIFKNFAKTIKNSSRINAKLSKNLKEQFINALVDVKDVVIFENESGIESIKLIASNEQILKKELKDSILKVIKHQVVLKNVLHLNKAGFSLASFVPKSKINAEFAISTKAKEKQNGDNAVITKIADNKYFVAIADGMGHGEQASRMSSMVLNLIKSMFEVGLDDELIIDSVNKLLIPAGLDNFTTLDACVVDLEKNECSFIKLGASVSVLKHKDTVEVVASDSLPIGVIKNISPTIVKRPFFQGDMIFLASDGVVDSFSNVGAYSTFINDAKIYNMQKFLDDVIFDAESLNTAHIDDMTIIGINLLKN